MCLSGSLCSWELAALLTAASCCSGGSFPALNVEEIPRSASTPDTQLCGTAGCAFVSCCLVVPKFRFSVFSHREDANR